MYVKYVAKNRFSGGGGGSYYYHNGIIRTRTVCVRAQQYSQTI